MTSSWITSYLESNKTAMLPHYRMLQGILQSTTAFTYRIPVTGDHTNNIQSYWERVKGKLKKMKGCKHELIPSYLDEFLWKDKYGDKSPEV